jgi:hypothetical protein
MVSWCHGVMVLWTRQDPRVMVLWPSTAGAHNTARGRVKPDASRFLICGGIGTFYDVRCETPQSHRMIYS